MQRYNKERDRKRQRDKEREDERKRERKNGRQTERRNKIFLSLIDIFIRIILFLIPHHLYHHR